MEERRTNNTKEGGRKCQKVMEQVRTGKGQAPEEGSVLVAVDRDKGRLQEPAKGEAGNKAGKDVD